MASLHKAIYTIHKNVKSIQGETEENIIAKDIDGNEVNVNWNAVNSWTDPDKYKIDRKKEYPLIMEQLDDIYHNGIDGWKETIKAIKDKYPKV